MDKKAILIFGVGPLQKSIIECCKTKGLYTIGIDPNENAVCKDIVDKFEVVGGDDYEKTIKVAEKYNIKGIITSATDKPLLMMARVAKALKLPFFSIEAAKYSTDKYLMKQKFQDAGIPCARGFIFDNIEEINLSNINFPVVVKPRDNSGSRGVILCQNIKSFYLAVQEAFKYTIKTNVLVEEFIDGKEYSVESIHYNGESRIIQITEKRTTEFPYNVELGHIQPADITSEQKNEICKLINKISNILEFKNCASHTELKISSKGITIIETSPRLGGDFISSTLVPLSTGINMEEILIDIAINNQISEKFFVPQRNNSSAIIFFELSEGIVTQISNLNELKNIEGIYSWVFDLNEGERVCKITSSLDRYGYVILKNLQRNCIDLAINKVNNLIHKNIKIS